MVYILVYSQSHSQTSAESLGMRLARQPLYAFNITTAHLQVLLCLDQLSLKLGNLVWLRRGIVAQLCDDMYVCVCGGGGGGGEEGREG